MRALTQTTVYLDVVSQPVRRRCKQAVKRLSLMYEIYCERRQMRQLSDEMLRDIGIDRAQLKIEYSKKITDIPENRIRALRDSQ